MHDALMHSRLTGTDITDLIHCSISSKSYLALKSMISTSYLAALGFCVHN